MRLRNHTKVLSGPKPLSAGLLLLVLFFSAAGCVYTPYAGSDRVALSGEALHTRNKAVYERAAALVSKEYFDPKFGGRDWTALVAAHRENAAAAKDTESLYQVVNELLAELKTSHLVALTPEETEINDSHVKPRIGVAWHKFGDRWVIEDVVPGSPAEAAGLKVGWIADSIGGQKLTSLTVFKLSAGVPVNVVCEDEAGVLHSVSVVPRVMTTLRPKISLVTPEGFLYLRFDEFNRESRRWLSSELKRHAATPGLVLDLRRNHGGELFSLDFVAAEFFEHSVSVGRMIKRSGRDYAENALSWASARYKGRIAILIDDSTYSAAEILSHALQYHKRATLVGRKTGGAVVAARDFTLPDGGSIQIPVTDFVGLDGRRIEGAGLEPDLPVERSLEAVRKGVDADLQAALAWLGGK